VSNSRSLDTQNAPPKLDLEAASAPEGNGDKALRELAAAFFEQLSFSSPPMAGERTPSPAVADESAPPTLEARYRVLVEQIPAVVFMAMLDGGLSEAYVSPHIEQTLGFTQEEWLDDPVRWYQQIHPEDRSRWSAEAAETFVTGKPLKSVYRVIARDGRVVWFHCEAKLVRKQSGEPWFVHGVGFDVTELKETELALQRESAERERLQRLELERHIARSEQSESRLAAIVESSEDAIIAKTLDGVITSWNAAATRLFGYQPDEVLGRSILLLVPPDLHSEEMDILQQLRAGHRIAHRETQRVTRDGVRVDVSLTISPIKDAAGGVIGLSSIARDITQQKQMEHKLRLTEKLAAAGRLAATISHEINNPLEAVTNLIFLAKLDASLSPQVRKLLERADRQVQRVAHIARQTLGFYRDTSAPVNINLAELLDDITELYQGKIAQKKLRVETRFDRTCQMTGSQGEMRQVFSNIVANAIEASHAEGALLLRLHTGHDWKNPQKVGMRVVIGDHGLGIPPQSRSRLFEPFYSTKKDVGTGLGLWVSKSLVEKHGGSIRFRSCVLPGRSGTVFSIFLPRAADSH